MVVRDSPPEAETVCEEARPMCATYMAAYHPAYHPPVRRPTLACSVAYVPAAVGYSLAYLEWPLADPRTHCLEAKARFPAR